MAAHGPHGTGPDGADGRIPDGGIPDGAAGTHNAAGVVADGQVGDPDPAKLGAAALAGSAKPADPVGKVGGLRRVLGREADELPGEGTEPRGRIMQRRVAGRIGTRARRVGHVGAQPAAGRGKTCTRRR